MKKRDIVLVVCIVVVLATSSVVFAYHHERKKSRESIVAGQNAEQAIVTIPAGITKIRIVDGTHMDVLTLDGDSIEEFFTRINSVAGTVEYVGEGSGYAYSVQCYKNDKRVLCFSFLTETIIREYVGDGTDRQFTAEQAIPAFAYIQSLFEEARARN